MPCKVLGRVLITRIAAGTDAKFRKEHTDWVVQVMYANCTSAAVDGDERTDWFEVMQGCNMSGFLFLLVID